MAHKYYTQLILGISCLQILGMLPSEISAQSRNLPSLSSEAGSEQHVVVDMESYQYTPSEIVLEAGQTVRITLQNQSFLVPHNFLLDDPTGARIVELDVSSGEMQDVQFKPLGPGIYPFYCDKQLLFFPSHREQGMEGRFLVR
ncbi:MAG: cupredoxin domain-containing protein [Nitrospirales bacterium]|nr:cupredoxin domain-containing protein [Nitrospirales bacterium]